MRVFPWFLALCFASGLVVVGCDDDGGSGLKPVTDDSPPDAGAGASSDRPPSLPGLDRSKYLDELNADEIQQLCAWMADLTEPGEHQCSGGTTMTTYTASECVENAQKTPPPHCLVSLTEDCLSSTGGDVCKVLVTDACMKYIACVTNN